MLKTNRQRICGFAIILVIVFIHITVSPGFADTTAISITPENTTLAYTPQTFQINVSISQVIDLAAWDFKLFYPSALLNATNIEEGWFLKQAGSTSGLVLVDFTDHYNATHGRIWAACALIGQGAGANGEGTLATITFKAISGGDAILHLSETDLLDSQMPSNHIPHTSHDGMVHIQVGIKDVAIVEICPTKTIVGEGYTTHIQVTAENQGSYAVSFDVALNVSWPLANIVNIDLFGSTTSGWGFSRESMTIPGPTISVKKGDTVNLTLTSADLVKHNFFVDYNGDTYPNPGEPKSPDFCGPPYYMPTINYKFTADLLGTFTYYCEYDRNTMFGTLIVTPPTILTTQIGKHPVLIASGKSLTLTFTWDTSGFEKGSYDLIAVAGPLQEETDLDDNTLTYSEVKVTIPGDITGDFFVNIKDVNLMLIWWQQRVPPAPSNVDINGDNLINIKDVNLILSNWLKDP
ncbi:MAG: hypothetical protein ACQXXH_06055 [Candidatus Bathyarchaeia archaeon]|nr:hypothetical protein [Candidatus Bathyarchaeota archaeon A05DMB-4]MDH7595339.1 hypothetical protein [Candidatus Bathyarchaeota archaeon]